MNYLLQAALTSLFGSSAEVPLSPLKVDPLHKNNLDSPIVDAVKEMYKTIKGNGDSDAFKTIEQILLENGFKTEKHTVTTTDGYILNIWRIPGKLNEENTDAPKAPVLMMHGQGGDMF